MKIAHAIGKKRLKSSILTCFRIQCKKWHSFFFTFWKCLWNCKKKKTICHLCLYMLIKCSSAVGAFMIQWRQREDGELKISFRNDCCTIFRSQLWLLSQVSSSNKKQLGPEVGHISFVLLESKRRQLRNWFAKGAAADLVQHCWLSAQTGAEKQRNSTVMRGSRIFNTPTRLTRKITHWFLTQLNPIVWQEQLEEERCKNIQGIFLV